MTQKKITLKARGSNPRSVTIRRLGVTFYRGRTQLVQDPEVIKYAKQRPSVFSVRDAGRPGRPAKRNVQASPPAKASDDDPAKVDGDKVDAEADANAAATEWIALCGESKSGLPNNIDILDFAEKWKIDLGDASKKADYVAVVEEHLSH